jgi:hypothetical protein
MWCVAVTCCLRISGVAAMAAADVNQPRAKANTTAITCLSCAAEHRRLAGGGIGPPEAGVPVKRRNKAPFPSLLAVFINAWRVAACHPRVLSNLCVFRIRRYGRDIDIFVFI